MCVSVSRVRASRASKAVAGVAVVCLDCLGLLCVHRAGRVAACGVGR